MRCQGPSPDTVHAPCGSGNLGYRLGLGVLQGIQEYLRTLQLGLSSGDVAMAGIWLDQLASA